MAGYSQASPYSASIAFRDERINMRLKTFQFEKQFRARVRRAKLFHSEWFCSTKQTSLCEHNAVGTFLIPTKVSVFFQELPFPVHVTANIVGFMRTYACAGSYKQHPNADKMSRKINTTGFDYFYVPEAISLIFQPKSIHLQFLGSIDTSPKIHKKTTGKNNIEIYVAYTNAFLQSQ